LTLRAKIDSLPEIDQAGPALPPEKEDADWNDFKAQAIEELKEPFMEVPDIPSQIALEQAIDRAISQIVPGTDSESPLELEGILFHLVQRIEGRFTRKAPPAAILSEDDKNMLREKIVAALTRS
jgi:hypothetical protein